MRTKAAAAREAIEKCHVENGIAFCGAGTPEERMSWYMRRWNLLKEIKRPSRWQSYALVLTEQRMKLIQEQMIHQQQEPAA